MSLRGADPETVRTALDSADPLPGTAGFAGSVDGRLVRDVLGRQPLFFEHDHPDVWSHDPTELSAPQTVPAGSVRDGTDQRQVWTVPDPTPVDDETAVTGVREAVDTTLDSIDTSGLAVAFSGGVDSAVLAARLDAPLYVAGFPDSHDVEAARSGAASLDRRVRVVELDHGMLEEAVPDLARATGRTNAMDIQIALGLALVGERAAADGFDRLALGQGADELFGGYAKVANAPTDPRTDADTVQGARREVVQGLPDQLERDQLALRAAGVRPVTPFLHDRVVQATLALSGRQLVRGDTRKWALREAVRPWLPAELATRDKKALQYGSLVARELDRLARQAGYKRRMDDHVTRYVEHLCTDE